jgi:integrase/recombinase XerD
LPKATLTHAEAEVILAVPDVATPLGLRDRTVMEILYATAMRRGEVVGLDLPDVDLARRWLTLRDTKNRWDRVVPMGERAAAWLTRYLTEARPKLLFGDDPGAVFLATNGERLGATWLSGQVHHYIDASEVGKSGSCHLFRHTCATLMLEGGADIRYIQELLGHRDLGSTHIYTRVAPERLAAIHAATHPSARLPDGTEDSSTDGPGDE